jgi:hypothetical protein
MSCQWLERARGPLFDLDAVCSAGGEPVDDVLQAITAELLVWGRDVHRYIRVDEEDAGRHLDARRTDDALPAQTGLIEHAGDQISVDRVEVIPSEVTADPGPRGPLDRGAQVPDRKYCRPHARPLVRLERAPHRGAAFALSNASKRARTLFIGSRSRGSLFIFRSSPRAVAPPGPSLPCRPRPRLARPP